MAIDVSDYEKLGAFYLGKNYDPESRQIGDDLVLYDSKDLVTHGVVLGMTGSGKTGLCIGLLEEAAMDHIPAIVIDPKGDIANLLLAFPELKGADFEPWINADDARKKGATVPEFAEKTAAMWEKGLAEWGQGPERIRQFKEKVDINIFTPGSQAGIPVSILSSLEVPPFEVMDDGELLGERIESTVSSLLSLVGVDADPIQSPEAILLSAIFQDQWGKEKSLSLESLIRSIQKPDFGKIGVIDLESFMSSKDRQGLALKFNNLLASPGFSTWLEGPPLDIQKMMYSEEGKPRISIFSIAHLSDSERMFFVSLLLNQMLGWMRAQSGTTSLRGLLYMDEIYGYLPPTANPPSKKPMMTMLKQARAFGLGVLVATQNPVDLDYKALSNMGTWWLGRLQTERDKARVLDGLESAASGQGGGFKRAEIEKMLSGLDSRVFLMNNVHEDGPVLMHVRWVMSYLRGPLQRRQIKTLMDPKRGLFEAKSEASAPAANPMAMSSAPEAPKGERPVVGRGVDEFFAPIAGEAEGVTYRPALLREAEVHFSSAKAGLEGSRLLRFVNPIGKKGIDWAEDLGCTIPLKSLTDKPVEGAGFAELPGYAMNADNYKPVEDEFADWIYRKERVNLFHADLYDMYSKLGESEGDFRARLALKGREIRDEAVEELRDKYASKLKTKQGQLERAEIALDKEKAQASSATWKAGVSIVGGLLGGLLGGRKSRRSLTSGATRAFEQRQDVGIAEDKVELIERELRALEAELQEEVAELEARYDASRTVLENEQVKPYKKDIDVTAVALLWLPYDEEGQKVW
ncbi:MAG: helicase HerA domain-containing protein [Verrucomicrobiales bacterium]